MKRVQTIYFITSFLTFYLRGEIRQQQNYISFKIPNTILTLIPLGAKQETIPINQIASVGTDFHLNFKDFLAGIVEIILAIWLNNEMDTPTFLCILLLLFGVFTILSAFKTILTVRTTSGASVYISFLIFEKSKAKQAEQQINYFIFNRLDDTNNRQQTDRIIDVMKNR